MFGVEKKTELEFIYSLFDDYKLKIIRDQIMGHADLSNSNNRFPYNRIQGVVDYVLIERLNNIQERLIAEFFNYTNTHGRPHDPLYFGDSEAISEMEGIMEAAKPKMTNDIIL